MEYFGGGDRPYLISGADDKLVKIWDYQTKSCADAEGHAHNVSAVCFHLSCQSSLLAQRMERCVFGTALHIDLRTL